MKKPLQVITLLLVIATLLAACQGTANTSETTEANMNIYQKSNPAEDDTLNILMIGNSGCYYYVEELYGLAEAAGIKLRVCNVYYSGCKLEQHWNWWKNKEAHYEFFTTDEKGRVKTEGCDLEYCLQQQNWDIISLQEGGMASLRTTPTEVALQSREVYLTELYGYLKEQFPQSRFYWQQNSAYQVGYNKTFAIESLEDQAKDNKVFRDFSVAVSEKYNVGWIPRGDAAQLVRETGYDNLCARLGKGTDHEGDFYHDGDWGGGQYLTACVWFEVVTGQSCIGNSYRPVYDYQGQEFTLSEDLVKLFQKSAHSAVEAAK